MSTATRRAVIFDVGNVLIPVSLSAAGEALAQLAGKPVESVAVRLLGSEAVQAYQVGGIDTDTFRDQVSELLETPLDAEGFREAWNASLPREAEPPEVLQAVVGEGWRVVTLSNTNALHAAHLEAHCPWLRELTETVYSHEIGAAKPDARAFRAAIERSGAEASACFFVDDDPRHVVAARELGLVAERFVDEALCREQLERLGFISSEAAGRRGRR